MGKPVHKSKKRDSAVRTVLGAAGAAGICVCVCFSPPSTLLGGTATPPPGPQLHAPPPRVMLLPRWGGGAVWPRPGREKVGELTYTTPFKTLGNVGGTPLSRQ